MASERPSKKQKIGDARDESMQEAGQRPMSRQLDSITSNTTNGVSPMSKQPKPTKVVPSPVQLSSVDGLPADCNVDTVSLGDIVGHPLIKECWAFNYLIDVDFLLSEFDPDIRDQIDLTVIHGSWKSEDGNKAFIEGGVARHENVKAIKAYMPEAYGTHHSKMIITVRHDDLAQIKDNPKGTDRIGSGLRFKHDLLSYLRAYRNKLKDLASTLEKFDFGAVRAALVASTPCRQDLDEEGSAGTSWGWPGLKKVLDQIPCKSLTPRIIVQISSVATLGVQDTYLRKTIFATLARSLDQPGARPKFAIVFPTADEVRRSINGYACGASIHMKIQTSAQVKQLNYLREFLCRWAPDLREEKDVKRAGRRRTGPHIKTYIRFSDESMANIDWAMVTSANLSKQAWGAEADKGGAVRICSYEIGVVVWPALWKESSTDQVKMVPTFKRDYPTDGGSEDQSPGSVDARVGFRMPYDLPLVSYKKDDEPWCATKGYTEPDNFGRVWRVS